MFKCRSCGSQSKASDKTHKKVVQTRNVTYRNIVNGVTKESKGTEIVRELTVCESCK